MSLPNKSDLEKRLIIVKKMAAKDPKYNSRITIIEKMIAKQSDISPSSSLDFGTDPSYLMTLQEYQEKVSPIFKDYRKFVTKAYNNRYLAKIDYNGLKYVSYVDVEDMFNNMEKYHWTGRWVEKPYTYSDKEEKDFKSVEDFFEYNTRYSGKHSLKFEDFKKTPKEIIEQHQEFEKKLAPYFSMKEFYSMVENDEAKSNKRAVTRAINSDIYKDMLKEGTLTEERLQEIADSVGVRIPKKVFSEETNLKKEISSTIDKSRNQRNKKELESIANTIISSFKPLEEYIYKVETERYKKLVDGFLSSTIDEFIPEYKITKAIPFYSIIFNYEEEYKIEGRKNVKYIKILSIKDGAFNVIDKEVKDNIVAQRYNMVRAIINALIFTEKDIESFTQIRLERGAKGFEGLYQVNFKDGSSFKIDTHAIGAGGYNIQSFHYRYLVNVIDNKNN